MIPDYVSMIEELRKQFYERWEEDRDELMKCRICGNSAEFCGCSFVSFLNLVKQLQGLSGARSDE